MAFRSLIACLSFPHRQLPVALRWLAGLLLLVGAVQPAHAWRGHKGDVKRQVETLEDQWRTAQLSGDISTMDRMLSDDYVGITMSGQVVTKPQQLDRVRNHTFVLTRLDLTDTRVKLLGQIAIVTVLAHVEGSNEGRAINGEYRYTRVYHQLPSGVWKITNFEATHIPNGRHSLLAQGNSTGRSS